MVSSRLDETIENRSTRKKKERKKGTKERRKKERKEKRVDARNERSQGRRSEDRAKMVSSLSTFLLRPLRLPSLIPVFPLPSISLLPVDLLLSFLRVSSRFFVRDATMCVVHRGSRQGRLANNTPPALPLTFPLPTLHSLPSLTRPPPPPPPRHLLTLSRPTKRVKRYQRFRTRPANRLL